MIQLLAFPLNELIDDVFSLCTGLCHLEVVVFRDDDVATWSHL